MPKKSKEEVLRDKLVKGFEKAGLRLYGKTFGLGDTEGYCADYVCGNAVIEIITSTEDKRLDKITKFKKAFGRRYTVFAFADDHMKDVCMVGSCDALYTADSLPLMIKKVQDINKE
jgi:hypothetical protein